jgi:hypothetical protein
MRIITLNVNGLRAAERKGFARWLARVEPWDVVCLQEIKCANGDVPRSLLAPRKAHASFHPAERRGYSGVALYAKTPPRVATGFGHPEFDVEGRYLQADFTEVSVISVYLPSGSSGPHRQASKFRFLDAFLPHLERLVRSGRVRRPACSPPSMSPRRSPAVPRARSSWTAPPVTRAPAAPVPAKTPTSSPSPVEAAETRPSTLARGSSIIPS